MASFRLLRRARIDLLDIATYTADRWGDAQAEKYLAELFLGFQFVADRPELRRPFREIPTYFRVVVGRHAVFYRSTADSDVLIVRVLHVSMLPELHLRGR
jgi:toxin ParE1/3/4